MNAVKDWNRLLTILEKRDARSPMAATSTIFATLVAVGELILPSHSSKLDEKDEFHVETVGTKIYFD